jgi:hypothetical protein
MRAYPINTTTISRLEVLGKETALTTAGTWMHLALTWQFATSTKFAIHRNGSSIISIKEATSYLEYSLNYANTWAAETDWDSSTGTNEVRNFNGFIYEVGISNYIFDLADVFDTDKDCSGYGGCDNCTEAGDCLSECEFNEYPISDGSCGSCQNSCNDGCVRA